jgi:hypothetical protein
LKRVKKTTCRINSKLLWIQISTSGFKETTLCHLAGTAIL